MPTLPEKISDQLKERTDVHHRNIETVERLRRVFAEDYQQAEYVDLLKKFYGFYPPLEEKCLEQCLRHPAMADGLNIEARQRMPLLRADLSHFGLSDAEIDALPKAPDLPELNSPARMTGCLYVLEGSTMGGQMISKHLGEKLNLDGSQGVSFYTGYGKDTMTMWKAFKQYMDDTYSTSEALEDISGAAGETFAALQTWLNQP